MAAPAQKILVEKIFRYPVKSLAGQPLRTVRLTPGAGLPFDRRFALAHGASQADPSGTAWAPKGQFYNLSQEERLAQLGLAFDEAEGLLTLTRNGKPVARGKPAEPIGRSLLDQFLAAFLASSPRGAPRLIAAQGAVSFSDVETPCLSLLNLASVADLERVVRQPVDPRRFRANVWLSGLEPWVELQWPAGQRLRLGTALLQVLEPIERCAATNVNPDSGERDLNLPRALQGGFGHLCQGVYAKVLQGGTLSEGDSLALP